MVSFFKKHTTGILVAGAIVLCAILLIFIATVFGNISDAQKNKTTDTVNSATESLSEAVNIRVDEFVDNTVYAADYVKRGTSREEFENCVRDLRTDRHLYNVKSIRYCFDGKVYDDYFIPCKNPEDFGNLVDKISSKEEAGVFGSITDNSKDISNEDISRNRSEILFYAKVENSPFIDAIVLGYGEDVLSVEDITEKTPKLKKSEFAAICTDGGRIMFTLYPELENKESAIKVEANADIFAQLTDGNLSSKSSMKIMNAIKGKDGNGNGIFDFSIGGEKYAFSVRHIDSCKGICVITLYNYDALDFESSTDNTTVVLGSTLMVLLLILIVLLFVFILGRKAYGKKTKRTGGYDSALNIPSRSSFEASVSKITEKYPGSEFAVIAVRIKHYYYIKEKFPDRFENIVDNVKDYFKKSLELGELIGAGDEGEFILLYRYSESRKIADRLTRIANMVSKNVGTKEYSVRLSFGVYMIDNEENIRVNQMVTNAFQTIDSDKASSGNNDVNFYNLVVKDHYMQSAEIELKMDFALKNDEFKVFFQPKIDARTRKVDSCEALVRWYDAEKEFYRTPDLFLPLFEQNGFIVKLDKYVFYKACEFIGLRISQRLPVFPTSVNISRVTALSDGFMEYYATVKEKFAVPDNFITLEFTESIASASYETLNSIAKALHKNRFLCSIDDYGSGYSSLNILKNIAVDEIKMDRIFLNKGISAERDRTILKSIVSLANELGIKVVQEGVETEEQLVYTMEAGCNIIQGYFYSKPLSMVEYIEYIDYGPSAEIRFGRAADEEEL